ncbi:hypothetical protein Gogos_005414 [Gossypium gossypioides]|uniref:Aminotransferase-like plant mobile domain-containing protein n=1 Tax=Gossypium gossypioides TaxID=34282 RepID=A0A7J9D785_GOSGO|nr:hypothetical protein [Gossypium gossypioides]
MEKALGYVSVELADFLFQIEKWVNPAPTVSVETIISLNFIRKKGDRHFLGCVQFLFVWMKSHFRCLCKRFRQVFVPSNRPIEEFLESEWPPNEWVQNLRWKFLFRTRDFGGNWKRYELSGFKL